MSRLTGRAHFLSLVSLSSAAMADGLGGLSAARGIIPIFVGLGLLIGGTLGLVVCLILVKKTGIKRLWWWLPPITLSPFLIVFILVLTDACKRYSICLMSSAR